MQRQFSFHKAAFLSLKGTQQHKKCAELLKELYLSPNSELENEYRKWCSWMNRPIPTEYNQEAIADLFHEHMQNANQEILLLPVHQGDRLHAEKWLGVTTLLDRLRSLHNIGSIMRTIEAFRLGPLVQTEDSYAIDPLRLQKSAMGAEKEVILTRQPLSELPRPLVALETVPGSIPYSSFLFPKTCTLVIGNEETGVKEKILQKADVIISIPLRGKKNSLNVANAFAIVAAEIARQRTD